MPKAYEEYWLTFENNLERQGRDPVDIKTGILDWCFTEQSLQSWVECAQMAPGGLSLQARRHVKCLYTASVWASVWKRVCQEPHHHNRWTAAERLFHIALWEHTPPPPQKKKPDAISLLALNGKGIEREGTTAELLVSCSNNKQLGWERA